MMCRCRVFCFRLIQISSCTPRSQPLVGILDRYVTYLHVFRLAASRRLEYFAFAFPEAPG